MESKKLYVGNLAYQVTEEELSSFFSQAGQVESVSMIIDRNTGRPRGFGFVEMATVEDAAKAIEQLNGQEVSGRKIMVSEARPLSDRKSGGNGGFQKRDFGGNRDFRR